MRRMRCASLLVAVLAVTAFAGSADARTTVVRTAPELERAVEAAAPGDAIALAPGTYRLSSRLTFGPGQSGSRARPVVVRPLRPDRMPVVNAAGAEEAFYFPDSHDIEVRGLRITGGAYHGVKIDGPSHRIRIVGNVIAGNTRARRDTGSQFSAIKGGGACPGGRCARDVLISRNRIFETDRRFRGTNIQGVDCNGCLRWRVLGNRIHDIRGARLAGTCVQFKSGSAGTVIARNRIWSCGLVGINVGGFGDPGIAGRPVEHVGGHVRNNVIFRIADAGISVIDARGVRVDHNTLWGNGVAPDVRVSARDVRFRNNILDRPLNRRDGTRARAQANLVLPAPRARSLFVGATRGDFHLRASARRAIDRGVRLATVSSDLDGQRRPQGPRPDIGADERVR